MISNELRLYMLEECGELCGLCGKHSRLDPHRILYGGSHGGKYDYENVMMLCREHHALVHSSKRLFEPILIMLKGNQDYVKEKRGYIFR